MTRIGRAKLTELSSGRQRRLQDAGL